MDFKLPENTTMIADTARRYLKDNYSFDTYIAQLNESNHLENELNFQRPSIIQLH